MQPPSGTQDTAVTRQMPPVTASETNSLPPATTLVGPSGDACPKCGANMAGDQRYCIDCGERRGDPRLPFMDGRTAAPAPEPLPAATAYPVAGYMPPAQPKGRWSSGMALLATIATLLLAMGVGVLIGNKGDSANASAQQPIIVGGGATTATGASDATAASASTSKKDAAAAASEDTSGANADAVAKKNGVKLAPKDVDIGGKCPKGSVGCEADGTFSGDYFK